MKRIIEYCKPYFGVLAIMVCIKFIGTMMDLVIPYILGYILDEVVLRCTSENLLPVFFWGAMMALCALIAVFTNIFANRRISLYSTKIVKKLKISKKCLECLKKP